MGILSTKSNWIPYKLAIQKGADIMAALGQPSFEGAFDSRKLYYVSQVMEAPVAGINTTKTRTIYAFNFDRITFFNQLI